MKALTKVIIASSVLAFLGTGCTPDPVEFDFGHQGITSTSYRTKYKVVVGTKDVAILNRSCPSCTANLINVGSPNGSVKLEMSDGTLITASDLNLQISGTVSYFLEGASSWESYELNKSVKTDSEGDFVTSLYQTMESAGDKIEGIKLNLKLSTNVIGTEYSKEFSFSNATVWDVLNDFAGAVYSYDPTIETGLTAYSESGVKYNLYQTGIDLDADLILKANSDTSSKKVSAAISNISRNAERNTKVTAKDTLNLNSSVLKN